MRLFNIKYLDDCDFEEYLTVVDDDNLTEFEIEQIEYNKIEEHCSCLMNVWASEITEVDGHKIVIE